MKKTVVALLLIFSLAVYAQETSKRPNRIDVISAGPGLGYDYGVIGVNVLFYPIKNIGLTAGVGYALSGVGYNFGTKLRLVTSPHRIDPYLLAMYGTNAAYDVKINSTGYKDTFTGFTAGAGIDFRSKKVRKTGYWSLAIVVPFISDEARAFQNDIENNDTFNFSYELPIDISIGYHFILY